MVWLVTFEDNFWVAENEWTAWKSLVQETKRALHPIPPEERFVTLLMDEILLLLDAHRTITSAVRRELRPLIVRLRPLSGFVNWGVRQASVLPQEWNNQLSWIPHLISRLQRDWCTFGEEGLEASDAQVWDGQLVYEITGHCWRELNSELFPSIPIRQIAEEVLEDDLEAFDVRVPDDRPMEIDIVGPGPEGPPSSARLRITIYPYSRTEGEPLENIPPHVRPPA